MFSKATVKMLTFVIALSTGLAFAQPIYRTFKTSDPRTQAKLYRFLVNDRKLFDEYFERIVTARIEDRTGLTLEYNRKNIGQETSDLPEDFRNAWEKNAKSGYYHLEASLGDNLTRAQAQIEVAKEQPNEFLAFERDLKLIAESYGVELSESGHLAY